MGAGRDGRDLVSARRSGGARRFGAGFDQVLTSVQSAIPLLQGRGSIDLPAGGSSSVGAAPIADSLPAYTREPQLQLTGKVPSFAVQPGRNLQIVLNGDPVEIAEPLTVTELLSRFEIDPRRVAVEHNLNVLKRAAYADTIVRDGDRVEIVNFVGGG